MSDDKGRLGIRNAADYDGSDQLVDLTYDEIEHETEDAWLFVFDKLLKWVPKTLGLLDRDEGIVQVPEWFATKEGLV